MHSESKENLLTTCGSWKAQRTRLRNHIYDPYGDRNQSASVVQRYSLKGPGNSLTLTVGSTGLVVTLAESIPKESLEALRTEESHKKRPLLLWF